jgi:hypothetical protein
MALEEEPATMPYDLRRKSVSGSVYPYEVFDRGGNRHEIARDLFV